MITHDPPRASLRRRFILLVLLTWLTPGMSRADAWFLKIDGVPGASAGWTPIQSAGALVCLPTNPTNGKGGAATFSCEVRKAFDSTSPWLLQMCGQGETNRRVTLTCMLTQPRTALHRITLDNVRVASVRQDGISKSLEIPQSEVIRFTFDKIEMASLDLAANGGITGGLTTVIDQTTGQGAWKPRPPFQVTLHRPSGATGMVLTWPAERGHRYHILSRATVSDPWHTLVETTASEDGPFSQPLPAAASTLFMRVEEVD